MIAIFLFRLNKDARNIWIDLFGHLIFDFTTWIFCLHKILCPNGPH